VSELLVSAYTVVHDFLVRQGGGIIF